MAPALAGGWKAGGLASASASSFVPEGGRRLPPGLDAGLGHTWGRSRAGAEPLTFSTRSRIRWMDLHRSSLVGTFPSSWCRRVSKVYTALSICCGTHQGAREGPE